MPNTTHQSGLTCAMSSFTAGPTSQVSRQKLPRLEMIPTSLSKCGNMPSLKSHQNKSSTPSSSANNASFIRLNSATKTQQNAINQNQTKAPLPKVNLLLLLVKLGASSLRPTVPSSSKLKHRVCVEWRNKKNYRPRQFMHALSLSCRPATTR